MTLVANARIILLKAWSIRFAAFSMFFAISEAVLPLFTNVVPPKTMAILAALSACGTVISRVVAQPETIPNGKPTV